MTTAAENTFFNFQSLTKRVTAAQSKAIDIAKANTEFTGEYAKAMFEVKTPAELLSVTSDYSKKGIELFQQHAKELIALASASTASSS